MDATATQREVVIPGRTDHTQFLPSPQGVADENRGTDGVPQRWWRSLNFFASLTLSLSIVAAAAQLTWLVFDLDHKSYGEGPILAMCERMRSETISASWMQEPPYTLSCDGPAYYWLTNALAWAG